MSKGWGRFKKQITLKKLKQDLNAILKNLSWKDALYILFLPLVWFCLMFLPSPLKSQLVLHIYDFRWWQTLTHGFVHQDWSHFSHNLQGYFLFTILALLLAGLIKEKKRLYQLLLLLALFVPIVSSFVQMRFYPTWLPNLLTSQGGSGVVSSLLSMLPLFWVLYFSKNLNIKLHTVFFLNVCLTYAGLLFVIIYYPIHHKISMIAVIALLFTLFIFMYKSNWKLIIQRMMKEAKGNFITYFLLIIVPLFFLMMPIVLFPRNILVGNSLIDFFMHYAGLILGLIIGYLFLFYRDLFHTK